MSEHRILLIENPARLSVDLGRIRIEREDQKDIFILPADIAVLLIHHHTVEITAQVLRVLVDNRAIVIITDDKHHPSGCLMPTNGLPQASSRLYQQLELSEETIKRLWQSLVQTRIRTEAANLRHFDLNGALLLERMVDKVEAGDRGHHEGQAAKHYWQHFFGDDFKRNKQGAEDLINTALNYGYAVLRALVARELAVASLTPMLGLGHRSRENPFNLADDLMEPYRYIVERHVREHMETFETFDTQARACILGFIKESARLGNMDFRLPAAIRETISSYCRVLNSGSGGLALPG
ncbi:MAG TPA: type II CRISPR-associated endonuclease Cas1 [Gammaproteobacteria bacterium]|nr:type II CRISPR-associated endonuclease Cas1 [Gammaproteobacteria bacterium]